MNKIYDFKNKDIKIEFNSIKIGNSAYINQPIEVIEYIEYLQNQLQQKDTIINEFMEELKWQRKVSLSLNKAFTVGRIDTLINKLQELKEDNK